MFDKADLEKYAEHFSALLDIDFHLYDVCLQDFSAFENTFCSRCPRQCDYQKTHLYGCYESTRWDNEYIYFCQMDFIFIAVPVTDEYEILSHSVIAGPILMGEAEDFTKTYSLPNMSAEKVNDLAKIMSAFFSKTPEWSTGNSTAAFVNAIYAELEELPPDGTYPIELEKQIQTAIINGDRDAAREGLNRLLGDIFFQSNGDYSIIKARATELLVLLSRSAIEGGADASLIFDLNSNYIQEIERFDTLEKLSLWLTSIINRFIGYVFEFGDIKHQDIIHKIIGYIKDNYREKITLDDIAEHIFMSKSYISRIFNEETGMRIPAFINKIRIDKSCQLLQGTMLPISAIAVQTGFEDQSYFTKQFKLTTGVSPKKFRETHRQQ